MHPGPTDAHYTPWRKAFVFFPKTTLSKQRVWGWCWKRKRTIPWTPPQYPPDAWNRWEYETEAGVIQRALEGKDANRT